MELVWQLTGPESINHAGCFRAYRLSPDYAGLAGRALAPYAPLACV